MIRILVIQIFCFCILSAMYGQESTSEIIFEIQTFDKDTYLKSCLDLNIYKENFNVPPKLDNIEINHSNLTRETLDDMNKNQIVNSYWKNDCLYVNINECDEKEIRKLIMYFSRLNSNQIKLIKENNKNK